MEIYDSFQEAVDDVKSKMLCEDCKFCYTWKNDGRWYRCENHDSQQVGIDQIPNPRTFGCINFQSLEENDTEDLQD